MTLPAWLNFYEAWELFWPRDVTYGELHGAANEESAPRRAGEL